MYKLQASQLGIISVFLLKRGFYRYGDIKFNFYWHDILFFKHLFNNIMVLILEFNMIIIFCIFNSKNLKYCVKII